MKREVLVKCIIGEGSHEEHELLREWCMQDPDHQKEYEEMKKTWESSRKVGEVPSVDIDKAWDNFVQIRANSNTGKKTLSMSNMPVSGLWWRVAAAVIFIGLLSFYGLSYFLDQNTLLSTANHFQRTDLPDGSTVYLNRHATMKYQKEWWGRTRTVDLQQGEVFFDIKRDERTPFVIQSGASLITVLGTSFHVRRGESETEVIVASGSVRVKYGAHEVVLQPNEGVVIADTLKQKAKLDTVPDQLYRYYVHQEFVFENTPLVRVFEVLGRAYDKHFVIQNESIGQLRYTATFRQQDLSQMIGVIMMTFNLEIKQHGDRYHIN